MATTLVWLSERLLATSVQSIVLAAVVWALCRGIRRLPASTQCALWWLVALQAVVGLFWVSPVQVPLLPAAEEPSVMPVGVSQVGTAALPALDVSALPVQTAWEWPVLLMALWGAGVLVMGWRTFQGLRASRQLLQASRPCTDRALKDALVLAADAHGLRRTPRLMLSDAIASPQLIGPWRPVLLLPAQGLEQMDDDQLDMALTHELTHLQRHDLWLGLVPALAQHLFFFHPVVHLAAREYAIAREAAVDAAVVAGNRHCRQHYARLLVQLGVASRPRAGLASASPTFLSLKRRLLMLQDISRFPRAAAALILAGVAVAGVMPLRLVAQPAPPVAPAPPVPPALIAPAIPPVPAVPAVPAAARPPVAPPVPTPPKAPDRPALQEGALRDGYVLVRGQHSLMNAGVSDLRQAQQLDQGQGALLLIRGGQRYVVHDADMLARFETIHAETLRLAEAQGALGDRQGQLGDQQGALGEQQGAIGERMGDIGERLGKLGEQLATVVQQPGSDARRQEAAIRQKMDQARAELEAPTLQAKMKELGARQAELGKQQTALGKQQAELGRQMAAASAAAKRESDALIGEAIASGKARPVEG